MLTDTKQTCAVDLTRDRLNSVISAQILMCYTGLLAIILCYTILSYSQLIIHPVHVSPTVYEWELMMPCMQSKAIAFLAKFYTC